MRKRLTLPLFILIAMLILVVAPACAPVQDTETSRPTSHEASAVNAAPEMRVEAQTADPVKDIPAPAKGSAPEGMVAFEGDLFVATTPPRAELWQRAGWRIGDQPLDTNSEPTPTDCTLYPHAGVPDQWVGACRGHILIPESGAQHITVMITNPDGSTTLVQVAPLPASN